MGADALQLEAGQVTRTASSSKGTAALAFGRTLAGNSASAVQPAPYVLP